MATAENLTGLLAIAFGIYAIAGGLSGLVAPTRWKRLLRELELSPSLQTIAGIVAFVIGVAIVCVQPIGPGVLDIVVALLGWAALVEGLMLIAMPPVILGFARILMSAGVRAYAGFSVLLGIAFLIAGLADVN